MAVLLRSTAESFGPSLYASAASRYIFRAMNISPRISGVTTLAAFCESDAGNSTAFDSSRKPFCAGAGCAALAAIAKLETINQSLETMLGPPGIRALQAFLPVNCSISHGKFLLKYTAKSLEETFALRRFLRSRCRFGERRATVLSGALWSSAPRKARLRARFARPRRL